MKTVRLVVSLLLLSTLPSHAAPSSVDLLHHWRLQSAARVQASGEVLSTIRYKPAGWLETDVPSTVLASQVAAGVFPDPYYGLNLRALPGMQYKIGQNFNDMEIPTNSPYHPSWWYRLEFLAASSQPGQRQWLQFDGINYRANIWLNGHRIAAASQTAGTYRTFEFNVTGVLRPGRANVLAVETFAPRRSDLAVNWVDWNPMPPDKNMGLWGGVRLTGSGVVAIRHPMVTTRFPHGDLHHANLTVEADLTNSATTPISATVQGQIGSIHFEQAVSLAPQHTTTVVFTPERYPQLQVSEPRIWWPYGMGQPELQLLDLQVRLGGIQSDTTHLRFGIRQVTSELTSSQVRLFKINGRPLLIRGGGWAPDMLLRASPQRLRDEFEYVRHLGLNTLRLEGKMESEDFFNQADEQGILVMAGWCCCDIWEDWGKWKAEQHHVAMESLRNQLQRLRSHPSLLVWLYGSDGPPPPRVEQAYLEVLKKTHWPNPWLSSASATVTPGGGVTGVKMTGPYDYVPPSYWSNPEATSLKQGGGFAFNTETSPGASIPTEDSLRRFLPAAHLWPIDEVWTFHGGGGDFNSLDRYNHALTAMYGAPSDLHDYVKKAQAMAYDSERAMFEAYGRNKYLATGVVQWMLNNAWPSTFWHLYDYYLEPGGAYFGVRKANAPLHVQFSYTDRGVDVVNNRYTPVARLAVQADAYDMNLKSLFSQRQVVDVGSDSVVRACTMPPTDGPSFVRLSLVNASGKTVDTNFYWLPARYSTFDWSKTTYIYTPSPEYEDLTALNHLEPVDLTAFAPKLIPPVVRVILSNPSPHLAFQVTVRLCDQQGHSLEPVLWDDNYIELMPGETRTLTAHCRQAPASIKVEGWNVRHVAVSTD